MKIASIPAALFLGGPFALLGAGALGMVLPVWPALELCAVAERTAAAKVVGIKSKRA